MEERCTAPNVSRLGLLVMSGGRLFQIRAVGNELFKYINTI